MYYYRFSAPLFTRLFLLVLQSQISQVEQFVISVDMHPSELLFLLIAVALKLIKDYGKLTLHHNRK
jgi:hypothetical protein